MNSTKSTNKESSAEKKSPAPQRKPDQRGPELDNSSEGFKGILNRTSPRTHPEAFASLLTSPELSHRANTSQRIGVINHLQRTYGNQYVQRIFQAKLKVGQPGDIYEQEADRVAEQVMSMPEPYTHEGAAVTGQSHSVRIQRVCAPCGEEENEEQVQAKPIVKQITQMVQRQYQPEEEEKKEEPVMAKGDSGRQPQISNGLQIRLSLSKGSGYPLPQKTRLFAENRFGVDFSQVKVHSDTNAVQMARALNAEAFTSGRDVYFGEGRYNPGSTQGKKLIAHELTHVIQQGGVDFRTKDTGYENRISHKRLSNTKEKTSLPIAQPKSLTSVPQIQTYGRDVHYDMTLREAQDPRVGFSASDARTIADADQAVDTGWRHPWRITPREFANPRVSGRDMLHFPARSVAVRQVRAAIRACNLRAFGAALHRYQDSYSHNFTTWSVPAWRIATSYCWRVSRLGAAAILLRNPAYGRGAVLKHACLLTYPDDYNKNSEQRTRDRNMTLFTRGYLTDLYRACASRPSSGAGSTGSTSTGTP